MLLDLLLDLFPYNESLYVLGSFCRSLLNSMEHFMPGDEQWYTDVAMTTECIYFSTVTTQITKHRQ